MSEGASAPEGPSDSPSLRVDGVRVAAVSCDLIGFPAADRRRLVRRASWLRVNLTAPEVRTYANAVVPGAHFDGWGRRGGVFDAHGAVVAASLVMRGAPTTGPAVGPVPEEERVVQTSCDAHVIYGGVVIEHFGHILLENLSRLWDPNFHRGRARIVVQTPGAKLSALNRRMYELAGFSGRVDAVSRCTRFSKVTVPAPAFALQRHAHVAYKTMCLEIAARVLKGSRLTITDQPLYLSRSRMTGSRRIVIGEERLEQVLERNGVRIVHPQELSLEEQILLVNTHRTIIGPIGSAFHLLMLSMLSNRAIYLAKASPDTSYLLCDALNSTRATYVNASAKTSIPIPKEDITRSQLPDFLDVGRAVSFLHRLGIIRSAERHFDTGEDERKYLRQVLIVGVANARRRGVLSLVEQIDSVAQREFPSDEVLVRQIRMARSACLKMRQGQASA